MAVQKLNISVLLDKLSAVEYQWDVKIKNKYLEERLFTGALLNLSELDFSQIDWADIEELPRIADQLDNQYALSRNIHSVLEGLPAAADRKRQFC